MRAMPVADVAVIGGGAAATAMLVALASRDGPMPSVIWVAPEGEDGRGRAYSTRDPVHRLNVRAARMSVRADLPDDFVRYLIDNDGHADPQGFYTRRRYGEYLATRAAECAARIPVERWLSVATGATRAAGGWQIVGRDGQRRSARHLVLAVGPQEPSLPCGIDPSLLRRGRYCLDPYAWAEQAHRGGSLRQIWIIGSGLTAVDLALTAAQNHAQARIHLLSRHGALPATHAQAHSTAVDALAQCDSLPKASQALRLIRDQCCPMTDWREAIDGLRARMADRWQQWPVVEQQRFLRHARWAWDSARHRMAPEVARAMTALIKSGQVTVHRGHLVGAVPRAQSVELTWRPRASVERQITDADLVLQATGLNTRVSGCGMPLLRSLLDQGLARPDPLDLGLHVDGQQRMLDAAGRAHADAHVLGALARGSRFECIAMPEIRSTAAAIVRELAMQRDRQLAVARVAS